MIINGNDLLQLSPIIDMEPEKIKGPITSYGLGEAGYDIRIKQNLIFRPTQFNIHGHTVFHESYSIWDADKIETHADSKHGHFALASSIEEFFMPVNVVGIVHDKSTWARMGLSVFNTVIEPGWKGFLTLELVYHGVLPLIIPAGSGIAQVIFHETSEDAEYEGKYQHQANEPVKAISSGG